MQKVMNDVDEFLVAALKVGWRPAKFGQSRYSLGQLHLSTKPINNCDWVSKVVGPEKVFDKQRHRKRLLVQQDCVLFWYKHSRDLYPFLICLIVLSIVMWGWCGEKFQVYYSLHQAHIVHIHNSCLVSLNVPILANILCTLKHHWNCFSCDSLIPRTALCRLGNQHYQMPNCRFCKLIVKIFRCAGALKFWLFPIWTFLL